MVREQYEARIVDLDDYEEGDTNREYHEQSLTDTWTLVIHTYPRSEKPNL